MTDSVSQNVAKTNACEPPTADPTPKACETICIYPFVEMSLRPRGNAKVCCVVGSIQDEGRVMSVLDDGLQGVWNSAAMREIRNEMVNDQRPAMCKPCFQLEDQGAPSFRTRTLDAWKQGWLNPRHDTVEDLKGRVRNADYYIQEGPETFHLEVGTTCNLKCRMCGPESSSAIAVDKLHCAWREYDSVKFHEPESKQTKLWYQDDDFVSNQLLANIFNLTKINFMGGEPFLIPEVRTIARRVIDSGAAPDILLSLTTNGTIINEELCDLAAQFQCFVCAVSLDGFGSLNEYIRYPSQWDVIDKNIKRLQQIPNAYVYAHMTLQAYNVLHVSELAQYCWDNHLPLRYYWLQDPEILSPASMPYAARQEAARRIRVFISEHTNLSEADHQTEILNTLHEISHVLDAVQTEDPSYLSDFIAFTNDLDFARKQNFATVGGDLMEFITASGTPWENQTKFLNGQNCGV